MENVSVSDILRRAEAWLEEVARSGSTLEITRPTFVQSPQLPKPFLYLTLPPHLLSSPRQSALGPTSDVSWQPLICFRPVPGTS